MIVKLLPEMTLAFSYAEGPNGMADAAAKVGAYLKTIGLDLHTTKKYFFKLSVSHGNHQHVTHLVYAVVPSESKGESAVSIVKLPAGEYLQFSVSKAEYDDESNNTDKKISDAASVWLKENKKKIDMKNVIGLIEEDFVDGYDMYNLYFPIK
ncbi:MAG TPA: hypothetical protein PK340_05725 [Bacilli bacterium]|jgi:hypothetical protein|nr:hypothetical protein [Bacilli bacterium]